MLIQAIHKSTGFKLGVLRKTWAKFLKEAREEEEAATAAGPGGAGGAGAGPRALMARWRLMTSFGALLASSASTRPGSIGSTASGGTGLRRPSKCWVWRAT